MHGPLGGPKRHKGPRPIIGPGMERPASPRAANQEVLDGLDAKAVEHTEHKALDMLDAKNIEHVEQDTRYLRKHT